MRDELLSWRKFDLYTNKLNIDEMMYWRYIKVYRCIRYDTKTILEYRCSRGSDRMKGIEIIS
jgi:hypothetical protein